MSSASLAWPLHLHLLQVPAWSPGSSWGFWNMLTAFGHKHFLLLVLIPGWPFPTFVWPTPSYLGLEDIASTPCLAFYFFRTINYYPKHAVCLVGQRTESFSELLTADSVSPE